MVINISADSSDGPGVDTSRPVRAQEEKEIVLIKWRDILQTADWTPANEVNCPTLQSIGWLISKDEKEVKIGSTLVVHAADDPQGTPFSITAFPIGCVEEIKPIS